MLLTLAAVLSSVGCIRAETNIQAIQRLQPEGHEMRGRLAEIADALPAAGDRGSLPSSVVPSPPIVLDFRARSYNTEVLMEPQLRDPDAEVANDLLLSPELVNCLRWTGPKNPLEPSAWNDRGRLGQDCEKAFSVRWLIVVRTVSYDLPERVELEVFVVDLPDRAILASFPIALEGVYKQADVGRGQFAADALTQLRSDAWSVARCALAVRLRALGSQVDLTEPGPGGIDHCANPPASFRVVEAQEKPRKHRRH